MSLCMCIMHMSVCVYLCVCVREHYVMSIDTPFHLTLYLVYTGQDVVISNNMKNYFIGHHKVYNIL